MSMHEARPGDIYVDEFGKLWRVVAYIATPSVSVEAVEPHGALGDMKPNKMYTEDDAADGVRFIREQKSGGVDGYMWNSFKRILRREEP